MMDKERIAYLNSIIERLHSLSAEERAAALAHLYSLRTAAVEDFVQLDDDQCRWDITLASGTQPANIMALIRDLIQLTDDEFVMIGIQVSARSSMSQEHYKKTRSEPERICSWDSPAPSTILSVDPRLPSCCRN